RLPPRPPSSPSTTLFRPKFQQQLVVGRVRSPWTGETGRVNARPAAESVDLQPRIIRDGPVARVPRGGHRLQARVVRERLAGLLQDRKSTRLNSSPVTISY